MTKMNLAAQLSKTAASTKETKEGSTSPGTVAPVQERLNDILGYGFPKKPKYIDITTIVFSEENEIFRKRKTPADYARLKAAILQYGCVSNPILLADDSELLAGESRCICCAELVEEGYEAFRYIPALMATKPLTKEEKFFIRHADNFVAAERDSIDRLTSLEMLFPSVFVELPKGRPHTEEERAERISAKEARDQKEKEAGLTPDQAIRQRKIHSLAIANAKKDGVEFDPSIHIPIAQEEFNKKRTDSSNKKKGIRPQKKYSNLIALATASKKNEVLEVLKAAYADKIIKKAEYDLLTKKIEEVKG